MPVSERLNLRRELGSIYEGREKYMLNQSLLQAIATQYAEYGLKFLRFTYQLKLSTHIHYNKKDY